MKTTIGRRNFLKNSLIAGSAAMAWQSLEEKALAAETTVAKPVTPAVPPAEPLQLPKGRIGKLELSRVICGGNLIGGWAHSRDLIYVSPLVKAYHTDEKIFATLQLAERRGINAVLTNPSSGRVINDYWNQMGSEIRWISDCATQDIRDGIRQSVDQGAHAVYLQGGVCDQMARDGKLAEIEKVLSFMKSQNVPGGLGAHSLDTVKKCVAAGFEPDFWVKTLHRDNYWSATPEKNRGAFDEVNGRRPEHDQPHDNMWCNNAVETIRYMGALKKPWIAFKTLAAGAIHPRNAFQWCFENGADFLCVGMFDFQVVENTAIAARALKAVTEKGRPRAWMA
ncbi:MAG: hypothetical protein Q7S40_06115 [Opitutaceae bacterium]|nr:hypothetical protein [Opitutaceae bacterium]